MDVAALLREEWSTVLLAVSGAAGAVVAAGQQEWTWAILSAALVLSCIRILQLTGWIGGGG